MNKTEEKTLASNQPVECNETIVDSVVEEQILPAQDGGKPAWLFLMGAAIIEIVAWGILSRYICELRID